MPKLSPHLAILALVFWLLSNWAGAHGHFCFDGQEPPVSVHMDVLGGHLEHHGDEMHQDADVDLQSVIAKLTKLEQALILLAVVALLLVSKPTPILASRYTPLLPTHIPFLRPLLRAPPFTA